MNLRPQYKTSYLGEKKTWQKAIMVSRTTLVIVVVLVILTIRENIVITYNVVSTLIDFVLPIESEGVSFALRFCF